MTGNNHLLQKVTFEIGLASQDGAFEIQNRISNAFQSGILRELEQLFDQRITSAEVITIEKIEIDLGRLHTARLEEELSTAITAQLEGFLATLTEEIRNSAQTASGQSRTIQVRWPLPKDAHFTASVSIAHDYISLFEKVTHLLEYGVMPVALPKSSPVKLADLIAPLLSEQPAQLVQFIRNNVTNHKILHRLVLNLTKAQLQYVASLLGCPFSFELPPLISEIKQFLDLHKVKASDFRKYAPVSFADMEDQLWLSILFYYTWREESKITGTPETVSDKVVLVMRTLLAESIVLEKVIAHQRKRKSRNVSAFPSAEPALRLILNSLPGEILSTSVARKNPKSKGTVSKHSNPSSDPETSGLTALIKQLQISGSSVVKTPADPEAETAASPFNTHKSSADEPMQVETGIYIRNAGLIILAPYLKLFFNNLGLLDGKNFKDEASAIKAVHLLQYACGFNQENKEQDFGEHDLLLNKIICGIGFSEPIPETLELSEIEKQETLGLLQAILNNWTIMKRSSVHALQVTFLQKEGRLIKRGNDWEMLVERDSAVEILIDKLPWAISLIKLPWNEYTIHTQW